MPATTVPLMKYQVVTNLHADNFTVYMVGADGESLLLLQTFATYAEAEDYIVAREEADRRN